MNLFPKGLAKYVVVGVMLLPLLFAVAVPHSYAAFGVSPPYVNADHLVPGATYSQVIYLVQDQPDQDLSVKALLSLQDPAKSWVSIDPGFNFVIPKGTRQFPVTVTVTVPKDAGLGVFTGSVSFVGAPAAAGQVTIALGVQVSLNFTVGNDIFQSFALPYLKILDIEEGWNPRVLVRLKNDGNVPEAIDGATFEVYNQFNTVRLAYVQLSNNLPQVAPFTTKEFTVDFPVDLHLGLGQYWGTVTFYQNGKEVGSQTGPFNVLPAGSLSSPFSILTLNIKEYWIYYLIGLIIIVLIVRRLFMKKRRRSAAA